MEIKVETNLEDRLAKLTRKAAIRFLEDKHYDIKEVDYQCEAGTADIVCSMGDKLVFCDILVAANDGFKLPKEPKVTAKRREKLETIMANYLNDNNSYVDYEVRWDTISMLVLENDRALIRRHVNILGDENQVM